MKPRGSVQLVAVLGALVLAAPAAAAGPGDTLLVSGPAGLAPPTADLFAWNVSGLLQEEDAVGSSGLTTDGTLVAFASEADDLAQTPADRRFGQVFVKNRVTGSLVDVTSGANGPSSTPSISESGTRVAFTSRATNLSPSDPFDDPDVYVKDLTSGTVTLASSPVNGGPVGQEACRSIDCLQPRISGDGQFVVFQTEASMVAGDTNDRTDVYRTKIADGTVALVSTRDTLTTPSANGHATVPSVSDNGRYVAYQSTGTDLVGTDTNNRDDIFVRDMNTTSTVRASAKSNATTSPNGSSSTPQLSGDGTYVAYSTDSTDVAGDVADNDATNDTYRRHVVVAGALQTTTVAELVSRKNGNGSKADGGSIPTGIDNTGAIVLFQSQATNLGDSGYKPYLRNFQSSQTIALGAVAGASYVAGAGLSGDGSRFTASSSSALTSGAPPYGFYVATASANSTRELLSRRANAEPAQPRFVATDADSYDGAPHTVSADGRFVVFASSSPEPTGLPLFTGSQVFRRDMRTGDVVRVSRLPGGAGADGDLPSISDDGTKVAFRSRDQLDGDDNDMLRDAYVADLAAPSGLTMTLVSRGGLGNVKGDGSVQRVQVSGDGRSVLFVEKATNLGAPGKLHAYVRTPATATTVIADRADGEAGAPGDGDIADATLSADGTRVAMETAAANLGDGDADTTSDVHVRDLTAGTTVLASRASGAAGVKGNFGSYRPVIAADGRTVAFRSSAKNLDPSASFVTTPTQAFVRDLTTQQTRLVSRVGTAGDPASGSVDAVSLSADGSLVAYSVSRADTSPNVAPDAAPRTDVVVLRTLATGAQRTIAAAPSDPTQGQSQQGVISPSLSADGRCLSFVARGADIVPEVSPDFAQTFFRVLDGDCQTVVPTTPGPGPGPGPGPDPGPVTPPELKPVISALSVSNKVFRIESKPTAAIAAVGRKTKRAPVGTTFRYTLNVQADTGITIQLKTKGRKVGGFCKKATKATAKRKACTRFVKVTRLVRGAKPAGKAKVAFSGRVGKVKLKPGAYRALLVAVGTGPNKRQSKVRQVTFRVVR